MNIFKKSMLYGLLFLAVPLGALAQGVPWKALQDDKGDIISWRTTFGAGAPVLAAVNEAYTYQIINPTATNPLQIPAGSNYISLQLRSGTAVVSAATTPIISGLLANTAGAVYIYPGFFPRKEDIKASWGAQSGTNAVATGNMPPIYEVAMPSIANLVTSGSITHVTEAKWFQLPSVIERFGTYNLPARENDWFVLKLFAFQNRIPAAAPHGVYPGTNAITAIVQFRRK